MAKEKADTDKAKAEQEKVRNAAPKKTTAKKYEDHSKQETNILFPEIGQMQTTALYVKSGKGANEVKKAVKETIHPKNVELDLDGEESRPTTATNKYVEPQSQNKHRTVITAMNKDPADPKVKGNQFNFHKDAEFKTRVLIQNGNQPKDKSKGK
jgi:hypothetical protein